MAAEKLPTQATGANIRSSINNHADLIDANDLALSGKVDKITGKGLSTEDYTAEEKTKLSGIEDGAEVNVPADWDDLENKPLTFPPIIGTTSETALKGDSFKGGFTTLEKISLTDYNALPVKDANTLYIIPVE